MELFVKVYFWVILAACILKLICIGWLDYPRTTERGWDVIAVVIGILWLAWSGYLVWL